MLTEILRSLLLEAKRIKQGAYCVLGVLLAAGKPCSLLRPLELAMCQGAGPAELGLRALAETTHLSEASHGARSVDRVNGHGPQLNASSQGPSRTAVRLLDRIWAEGDRRGYGRQMERGSGAGAQQILTSRWCSDSDLGRLWHFSKTPHPEVLSQHGNPNKIGPNTAWVERKPLLERAALRACPRPQDFHPPLPFLQVDSFSEHRGLADAGLLPTMAPLPLGAG